MEKNWVKIWISPKKGIAILKKEGLDVPSKGEYALLESGAVIHRPAMDKWLIIGCASDDVVNNLYKELS
jgi:hypothetical protein